MMDGSLLTRSWPAARVALRHATDQFLLGTRSRLSTSPALRHVAPARDGDPARDPRDPARLAALEAIVGRENVLTEQDEVATYNVDWTQALKGNARPVVLPTSTDQISQLLRYCNSHKIPVVPQGGNTGIAGAAVPLQDEVIINLKRMNRIHGPVSKEGVVVCDAGCTLDQVDCAAQSAGFTMPLGLASRKSCQIGGNVSTNAGGLNFVRFGSLRASVLGVEVVRANGDILDLMKVVEKDNTGYDLKQLFIGSEGTLGVVSKAAIKCPPLSASKHTLLLAVPGFAAVQQILTVAYSELSEVLSAFEFMDREAYELPVMSYPDIDDPLADSTTDRKDMYVLIETSGSNKEHDRQKLESFLKQLRKQQLVDDQVLAHTTQEAKQIWKLREYLAPAIMKNGTFYMYDLSLPVADMYKLVEGVRQKLNALKGIVLPSFGHIADGNLHLNIMDREARSEEEIKAMVEPYMFEFTAAAGGSISAEHGIGVFKRSYLQYGKPPGGVELMQQLKHLMDPNGILNPGKVLPT